jgi:hypothetical protein
VVQQDFFNVGGVNGNITVNEGSTVSQDLRLSIQGETNASGFAGTTTHRFNGNTITYSRSGPSGATSTNQGAGGGGVTQDFFGTSFYYGQDGAHTVSFNQNFSMQTTENSSFSLGTNNITWASGQSNSRTVTVLNVAPNILNATINGNNGNVTVNEGATVGLQMQSGDPGDDTAIFTINGAFGNAGTVNQAGGTTRTSNIVNQNFADDGVFNLSYQVNDDDTSTSTTRTLTVLNVAPTLTSVLPGNITVGQNDPVAFSATAFDPGVNDVLTFQWDFENDSTFDFTGSAGVIPGGYYPGQGVYTVLVQVDDGDGGFDTATFTVTVVPEPSTIALAGMGALALVAVARRRRKSS